MAKRSKKRRTDRIEAGAKVADRSAIAPANPAWLSRDWLFGLILFLAVLLAYTPVWWAGYIWDDDLDLTANPCVVGPLGLKEIWTTPAADICPLTLTTFWVEHKLWGLAPLPYHLVNVLLQGLNAIVLWRVLRKLKIPGAWLGAALWALHPVMVESVAWISELKNTESGLFYLLSIYFFLPSPDEPEPQARKGWKGNYALTLLFAALAMASKSSTVILPVVLCLCAWWSEGRWNWRNLVKVSPIFLMAIIAGLASIWTQQLHLENTPGLQWARSWPERLAAAGDAVWFYLGKLLWPHPLMILYPRWEIETGKWFSYLPLVAVIGAIILLWLKRESWGRTWFFCFAYFLLALLPVLGLINNTFSCYSLVADHFQYLAAMAPLALAGAGFVRLADVIFPDKPKTRSILGATVLALLGLLSWRQAWLYQDQITLWKYTVAANPTCWTGYSNLGALLYQQGNTNEAVADLQKSLELNPGSPDAQFNLAVILSATGQLDEALLHFQKAVEINPNDAEAHHQFGLTLEKKGQTDAAILQYQKTLEIDPGDVKAMTDLGNLWVKLGRTDEAIAQFAKALDLDPDDAHAHNNLGVALARKGQTDAAIVQFKEALRLQPNLLDAQKNLTTAQSASDQKPPALGR